MRRSAVLVLLLASCTTPEPTAVDDPALRPEEEIGIPPISGANPSLAWSTYVGTPSFDAVRDVAVDPQGLVYAAGASRGPGLPTSDGGFQRIFQGTSDAFVTKFDPVGGLRWTTYLGGSAYDRAYGIEVAPNGDVVVAGRAGAGFPVTPGAFQTTFRGGSLPSGAYGPQDGFVCRLTATGQRKWCSYFGTRDYGVIRDVAVDANGDIYIAAVALDGAYPPSWFQTGFQKTARGGVDNVVAKIAGDGSHVMWLTLIGGSGDEGGGPSLRVDGQGYTYVYMTTNSTNMPRGSTSGRGAVFHGQRDGFVAKIAPDGSRVLWGYYLGGSGTETDETHHITLDAAGDVYVGSQTNSVDFPTTPGVWQPRSGGTWDGFITKFSNSGQLLASTYFGGSGDEIIQGLAVAQNGTLYFSGATRSVGLLATLRLGAPALQDVIAVAMTPDLARALYVVRMSGSSNDVGRATAVDLLGDQIVGAEVESANFPVRNPLQGFYRGSGDGAVITLRHP